MGRHGELELERSYDRTVVDLSVDVEPEHPDVTLQSDPLVGPPPGLRDDEVREDLQKSLEFRRLTSIFVPVPEVPSPVVGFWSEVGYFI